MQALLSAEVGYYVAKCVGPVYKPSFVAPYPYTMFIITTVPCPSQVLTIV